MPIIDLSTNLLGMKLENPTVLASGILGTTGALMASVANEGGAGAITTKSASIRPRPGHPNPIVVDALGEGGWMLNAVGLSNPGVGEKVAEIAHYRELCKKPLIASVFASTAREFGECAALIAKAKPDAIELDESCPNVEGEFGALFCLNGRDAAKAVEEARNAVPKSIPIFAKLSPSVPDIASIARACAEAGADGITAVNTAGPGMAIDISRAKPILANRVGGISGPALKPLAVRCVYDIYEELEGKVPIIGTGGVANGADAIEMMMAGASAVGIGTAAYGRGMAVFMGVCREMETLMGENGYSKARELVGMAHG